MSDNTNTTVPAASDFEYANPMAAPITPEPVVEVVDEDDDLFSSDAGDFVAPDPNAVIILRFSSGDTKYVPASEPISIAAAMCQ
jgi:hypothetical protein